MRAEGSAARPDPAAEDAGPTAEVRGGSWSEPAPSPGPWTQKSLWSIHSRLPSRAPASLAVSCTRHIQTRDASGNQGGGTWGQGTGAGAGQDAVCETKTCWERTGRLHVWLIPVPTLQACSGSARAARPCPPDGLASGRTCRLLIPPRPVTMASGPKRRQREPPPPSRG